MNAIELADELRNAIINDCLNSAEEEWYSEIEAMLREQAKEIEELKEDLKNRNINIEYLKEKLIASIDDIKTLKAELEDCICQGGHSAAYLKVKGKK